MKKQIAHATGLHISTDISETEQALYQALLNPGKHGIISYPELVLPAFQFLKCSRTGSQAGNRHSAEFL